MGPSPTATGPTKPSSSPRASRRRSWRPDAIYASHEAIRGRPRQGTRSPSRARLPTEGLGRRCIFRVVRGLSRKASARSPISISREASFSALLEAGSSATRRPPASADPPDSTSCLINTSTTPAISTGRWLDTAEWPTGQEVTSTPYRLRQGAARITSHCILALCP